jgi:hypothetical protein
MSLWNWLRKLTGATALCVTIALGLAGTAQATFQPNYTNGTFAGVSCTNVTARENACTAVGHYMSHAYGYPLALVERFNGSSWSLQSLPNPRGHNSDALEAVSCPSATDCIAVGYSFSSVGPGGGSPQTLAEHWNGSGWNVMRTVNPAGREKENYLYGVSCTSSRACTAVGSYVDKRGPDAPLAERWNGHSWKVQFVPDPEKKFGTGLDGVSCSGRTSCTAVGTYYVNNNGGNRTLAEHWGGHHWRVQSTPRVHGAASVYLNGVSCTSASACTAVGDSYAPSLIDSTLAERWNGHHWTIQSTPTPPVVNDTYLQSVSCTTADSCTAVGSYFSAGGPQVPLAEAWTHSGGWTLQTATDPGGPPTAGEEDAWLYGVSCTDANNLCTAVGFYPGDDNYVDDSVAFTLAEVFAGGVWNTQTTVPGINN